MSVVFDSIPRNDPCLNNAFCSICFVSNGPLTTDNSLAHASPGMWWQGWCWKPVMEHPIHNGCLAHLILQGYITNQATECPTCLRKIELLYLKERIWIALKSNTNYRLFVALAGIGLGAILLKTVLIGALTLGKVVTQ